MSPVDGPGIVNPNLPVRSVVPPVVVMPARQRDRDAGRTARY